MTVAGYEALEDAIRARFGTLVEDAESIPTQYDNQEADETFPPEDGTYIRLKVNYSPGIKRETGGAGQNRYRVPGNMTASCFLPLGEGPEAHTQLADTIASAFRGESASGVTYRTPTPTKVGVVQEEVGDRFQLDVDVPFFADIIE